MYARSEKDPLNNEGGVDYINYIVKHDERTEDGRLDRQGQILMLPGYHHDQHKNTDRKLPETLAKSCGIERTNLQLYLW